MKSNPQRCHKMLNDFVVCMQLCCLANSFVLHKCQVVEVFRIDRGPVVVVLQGLSVTIVIVHKCQVVEVF